MPPSYRRELAPELRPPMLARRRALLRPPDTRREREPALAGTRAKAWHRGRRSARREPESGRDIERVRVEPDYPAAIVAALRVGAAGRRRIAQRPEHAVVVGETNETTMAPYLVATDEQPAAVRDAAHERVSGAWHIHLMEPALTQHEPMHDILTGDIQPHYDASLVDVNGQRSLARSPTGARCIDCGKAAFP